MNESQALMFLEESNIQIFKYFQFMGVIFNSCLCIDLYSTYKEPFYPIDRRIKRYVSAGFFGAFLMSYLADTILLKD
jgi:hypothetical protein